MLRVEGLSKAFGPLQAVQDMRLEASRGRITALIGPNGAGKTTTFNMITGFLQADRGSVFLEGTDITRRGPHAVSRLGCVRTFQGVEAFQGMTVLQNVMIGAGAGYCHKILPSLLRTPSYRRREREAETRSLEALESVGLQDLAHTGAGRLGFGQLRLMEIARALAASPAILLLDEPGSGLNSREVEDLMDLLKALNSRGITILIIDHDMQLIMNISDTVFVMDKGARIAAGTPAEIQGHPAVIEAYLGG
jgi:branched-chain amino acid transport system ATP-binding protein